MNVQGTFQVAYPGLNIHPADAFGLLQGLLVHSLPVVLDCQVNTIDVLHQLNDGTGSITLYTATGATFAGTAVPTTPKTVVGIATPFTSGNEIKLRDPAIDVY